MLFIVLSGFILAALAPTLSRYVGRRAGWCFAILPAALTLYFVLSITQVASGQVILERIRWIPSLGVQLSFYLDGLSLLFALLISGIGVLVVVYSGGYLAGHSQIGRFYSFLFIFMASMLGIVLSDNVILLFIFWELTSFSSYLLIGFDHERPEARSAALQALIVTGAGGLAMLAGLLLLGVAGGSFELSTLLGQGELIRSHSLYIPMLVLILAGAFTKSSQFPFHFWLPNAMQAPAPVSAYLHSSTMVQAGIYLLARMSPVLGGTDAWHSMLVLFGGLTMLAASVLLIRKTEAKALLAYSTVSALGFLTVLIGIGSSVAIKAAVAFLLAHALYKGALFLVAGAVDHETGERNTERMGGIGLAMPVTAIAAFLAALSMAGLPPLLGFAAKESVYEAAWGEPLLTGLFALSGMLFVVAAWLVAVKPFLGKGVRSAGKVHEAPPSLWLGPAVLAGLGLYFGIFPAWVGHAVLAPGASAILARPIDLDLSLWHGASPVLFLSAGVLAGGVVVTRGRGWVRQFLSKFEMVFRWGPERWYHCGLDALIKVAGVQTRLLQSGYLRRYLLVIVSSMFALVGYTLLTRLEPLPNVHVWDVTLYEFGLAVLILLSTVFIVKTHSRLIAVVALGVIGYAVALLFLHLGAPDLAMTQLVVDTITVILFVLVLRHLPRFSIYTARTARFRDAIIAVLVGGLMTTLVLLSTSLPLDRTIAEYFAANSQALAHGRNIVNVILVDFRGLDTLGEITVLVVAGLGIAGMLKLRLDGKKAREGD